MKILEVNFNRAKNTKSRKLSNPKKIKITKPIRNLYNFMRDKSNNNESLKLTQNIRKEFNDSINYGINA